MKTGYVAFIILVTLALAGCPMVDQEDTPLNSGDIGAAGAVSVLSGAVTMGLSYAPPSREGKTTDRVDDFLNLLEPEAGATITSCDKLAASDVCSNRTKSATYSGCFAGTNGATFSGSVSLTCSDENCAMPLNGIVSRTVNIERTTSNKSVVRTSSDLHADYRGNTIGGGASLVKRGSGNTLTISGLHKTRTSSNGTSIYDLSVRTLSSITTSDPTSSTMVVSGGSLEVAHNNAHYVATLTPNNLYYDFRTCCYPSSGNLTISYSGAVSGTAVLTFGGSGTCGSATLTVPGSESGTVTLVGCD